MPTGGFFVYADCSPFGADSERFCRDVLEGAGVAITPGIDFGATAPQRMCVSPTRSRMAKLEDGVARLRRFLGAAGAARMTRHGASGDRVVAVARSLRWRSRCGRPAGSAVEFYWQGFAGQLDLLARARPIAEVIDATSRRRAAGEARSACRRSAPSRAASLRCPTTAATRATPISAGPSSSGTCSPRPSCRSTPRQWCFPVAGCVTYRGYFAEADARAEAARLSGGGRRRPRGRRSRVLDARLFRRSGALDVHPLSRDRRSRGSSSTSSRTRSST